MMCALLLSTLVTGVNGESDTGSVNIEMDALYRHL
jgi:hypothetical protein